MAFVRVEQRNGHLAGAVRLVSVEGRGGPISKATLTAIINTRKGSGGDAGGIRGEEYTAIQWTLWGKQAENAGDCRAWKTRYAILKTPLCVSELGPDVGGAPGHPAHE